MKPSVVELAPILARDAMDTLLLASAITFTLFPPAQEFDIVAGGDPLFRAGAFRPRASARAPLRGLEKQRHFIDPDFRVEWNKREHPSIEPEVQIPRAPFIAAEGAELLPGIRKFMPDIK